MVDQFIEDVALRLATVSIVVMNDITLYDQIYLETVRDTLQRYRKESMNAPELPQRYENKCRTLIDSQLFSIAPTQQESMLSL